MVTRMRAVAGGVLLSFVCVTTAWSAGDPANKCQSDKQKAVGKLAACTLNALAKSTKAGLDQDPAALAGCSTKFSATVAKVESKAGGACPTSNDTATLAGEVAGLATRVSESLAGVRFVDNGDGTITDTVRGMIWQQQSAGTGCAACVDEPRPYGAALAWLGSLNGTATANALGGHRDWGLPTIEELQSIVDCAELPCKFVDPILGPNPTPPAGGQTRLLSGTSSTLPMSTLPCFYVLVMEDGSTACLDQESTQGSSRARIMNNAR